MSQDETTPAGGAGRETIPPPGDQADPPASSAGLTPGDRLGRYRIEEKIGAGGMGIVYAAYDEELDRRVAIKLLRPEHEDGDLGHRQDRLMREARAMARLSNPNVNTVYEVGAHRGQLYLVMELIDGQTLGDWLATAPRTWRDVVSVFIQAGRGLAAAHRAGLIHRDVKPDNLLVGKDGRVRVTDFGLVSTTAAPSAPAPNTAASGDLSLTHTGARLGSPAYMSPEQHEGHKLSAASDQFSFCVSLYEALYGQRPFSGDSIDEISDQIRSGALPASPAQAASDRAVPGVPARLHALLRRGLNPDPSQRFADMDALLAELGRDPARRRKRLLAWGGLAAALLAGVGGAWLGLSGGATPCAQMARHLDGIWDDARRAAIKAAFDQTGLGHAASTFQRVAQQIDAYTAGWTRTRREACEATQVHREQSAALMDLRMRCLDRRLGELQALLTVLSKPDLEVVNRAVQAVAQLGDLTTCSNGQALMDRAPPPADEAGRRALHEAEQTLARAQASLSAGKYPEAETQATRADAQADALGYRPMQAEAELTLGEGLVAMKKLDAAEQAFHRAVQAAEASHHDRVAARAWIALVNTVGNQSGKIPEAKVLLEHARAAIERLGGDEGLESDLLLYSGRLHQLAEDLPRAQREIERSLDLRTKLNGPDHLRVANALAYLASVLRRRTNTEKNPALIEQALAAQRRSLAITQKALGDGHPRVAQAMTDLAAILDWAEKPEEAMDLLERAVALWSAALPADHPALANAYNSMASVQLKAGRPDQAITLFEQALAVREKAFGPNHFLTADIHFNLGILNNQLGKLDQAQAQFELAAQGYQSNQGQTSAKGAIALYAVCGMLRMKGQLEEGLARCRQSLAIWEQTGGQHKGHMARTLVAIGQALLGLKRPAEAIAPLERALALHLEYKPPALEVAEARFELARALWDAARDRPRARKLARQAWDHFKTDQQAPKDQRDEVAAWIEKRGGV